MLLRNVLFIKVWYSIKRWYIIYIINSLELRGYTLDQKGYTLFYKGWILLMRRKGVLDGKRHHLRGSGFGKYDPR